MSGIFPRKRFGQNFLRDAAAIHRIAAAIAVQPGDHVVEIGPGDGALTEVLLNGCGLLDAIEIDRDLVDRLTARFRNNGNFRLHRADALRFDFRALAGPEKLRVVGNLPYNISTPLAFHLFSQADCIEDMHFMLQKEVVNRIAAEPGTGDYGRLSVMAQYYCVAEKLFEVFPESFFPQPKVISAIVRLVPNESKPADVDPAHLGRIVATAFSQRRKTLRNSLQPLFDLSDLQSLGLDPGARAETLSLEDYCKLARRYAEKSGYRA